MGFSRPFSSMHVWYLGFLSFPTLRLLPLCRSLLVPFFPQTVPPCTFGSYFIGLILISFHLKCICLISIWIHSFIISIYLNNSPMTLNERAIIDLFLLKRAQKTCSTDGRGSWRPWSPDDWSRQRALARQVWTGLSGKEAMRASFWVSFISTSFRVASPPSFCLFWDKFLLTDAQTLMQLRPILNSDLPVSIVQVLGLQAWATKPSTVQLHLEAVSLSSCRYCEIHLPVWPNTAKKSQPLPPGALAWCLQALQAVTERSDYS